MPESANSSLHFSVHQFEILLKLYKSSFSSFNSISNLHEQITKSIVEGLQIARASIWEFEEDVLKCKKLYDAEKGIFVEQEVLKKKDFPNYFQALQKGIAIVAAEAQTNVLTNELKEFYLEPLEIMSMLDIPIREDGKLIGILCCEQTKLKKSWSSIDISFARSVADILSLFTAELKRKFTEEHLQEDQDRFKFISENISDGIYIIENDELVFASKTYLDMIGMTDEQKHSNHKQNMFHLVHPDDVENIKKTIYDAAANKVPSVKYVFRCQRGDGQYIWREDIMNIHYDSTGHAFRAVGITRDITEEKKRELESSNNKKSSDLQNKLLLKLYSSHEHTTLQKKITQIITLATQGLKLDRASYWVIKNESLVCKKVFDKNSNASETRIPMLKIREIPKYIEAINNQMAVVADDVYHNENTIELINNYLKPLGITDMLDVPIRVSGKFFGVLCCEHREAPRVWSENDISFARALADYLSLAIEEEKRKKTELKLSENQKKLEFISENTSDGIMIIENSKINYISPAFSKLSGYSLEFLQKLSLEEIFALIHPEDVEGMKKLIYQNLESHVDKFKYEYRILGTDYKYYWREDSVNVIYREQSDGYSKYIVISRDIQERKETELRLKESEQQLRLIFENSTDGFVVIENQLLKYISPSYRSFLGFTNEDLHGFSVKNIFDLIHPEDQDRVITFVNQNIRDKKKTFTCEFRIKNKNGKYHWREDLANVIYDDTGNYQKYIITSRDIHERKKMEKQLIESEQQLRLITENTSDGVAVIEEGKLTYVSPSYYKLLGYSVSEYQQFSIQDVFDKIHPEDVDRVRKLVYHSLEQKIREIKYEHRFRGADGTYHWREDSANVIYDENGKYTKYIVVTRDISARKEVEKEKNRLYEITEKQNEKLINFTHIVSHDIRSHTSNLSMILDLFEETTSKEEQKEYFEMLKQSTNKLSDTIFFLNETVAIQSGIKSEKTVLNLKDEIQKALVGINAIIKTSHAQIRMDVEESYEIVATQSYFESIIFNLLTNAIKYKSPARDPVITITATQKGEEIQLSIADNGLGIDLQKNKDKLFGMYKTFHNNPDAVGLGLFMVKNHMDSIGGRIEIESEVNKGTLFNLYFK